MRQKGTSSKGKITKRKEKIVKKEQDNSELFEEIGHLTTDKTGKIFKI